VCVLRENLGRLAVNVQDAVSATEMCIRGESNSGNRTNARTRTTGNNSYRDKSAFESLNCIPVAYFSDLNQEPEPQRARRLSR
jgi:hypothetical protein